MKEVWKPIKKYEKWYEISDRGRVKSKDRKVRGSYNSKRLLKGRIKAAWISNRGYRRIQLCNEENHKHFQISRLVAEAFIGKQPKNKKFINHIDGNKLNDRVENLEWCTQSENVLHAYKKGLAKPARGELNGQAKLNEKQVRIIKHILNIPNHISFKLIANILKVHQSTIYDIKYNRTWKHLKI